MINFVCPKNKSLLKKISPEHLAPFYQSNTGESYEIVGDIPNFIVHDSIESMNVKKFYDLRAQAYEDNLHLTFYTHNLDEKVCRNGFIDKLNIQPASKILEISCGTGRDSELIASRLNSKHHLSLLDISPDMIGICKKKLSKYTNVGSIDYCLANASYLPYEDKTFDSVYSFGGLGEFPNISKCLQEIVRVTKVGGRVVVGDESIPPWLRNTDFFKILNSTNPQFSAEIPLQDLPIEARDVQINWVIGGTFYLISFTIGDGEPVANFDYEIPGVRGGTYRTRYEGQLEGVSPDAKEKIYRIARETGTSVHTILNNLIMKL